MRRKHHTGMPFQPHSTLYRHPSEGWDPALNNPLSQQIRSFALKDLKVDLIGFCSAESDPVSAGHITSFIKAKRHGQMHWFEDTAALRTEPQMLLPEAKTVIVIALNYYRKQPPTPKGYGKIARYAYGRDYHKVLRSLLKKLVLHIESLAPSSQNRICVDSAPLSEKSYAVKAGLGFIGKNTTLINPKMGSFLLLGEIITSLDLPPDKPLTGSCGTCERCLAACPTQALLAPGKMDARRCISYLTVESKGQLPKTLAPKMRNYIFGCDICQQVCPYNIAHAKPLKNPDLKAKKIAGHHQNLKKILAIESEAEFTKIFAGSPLMRAKLAGLKRNAKNALGFN